MIFRSCRTVGCSCEQEISSFQKRNSRAAIVLRPPKNMHQNRVHILSGTRKSTHPTPNEHCDSLHISLALLHTPASIESTTAPKHRVAAYWRHPKALKQDLDGFL